MKVFPRTVAALLAGTMCAAFPAFDQLASRLVSRQLVANETPQTRSITRENLQLVEHRGPPSFE